MALDFGAARVSSALKALVSSRPRRSQNTTTARPAPTKKGMRQPQALSASSVIVACRTMSNSRARSWPEIRVTYWKLDQKPRFLAVAISDR
ncbi:hypothetical protein D3C73_884270 [compost metagenome]